MIMNITPRATRVIQSGLLNCSRSPWIDRSIGSEHSGHTAAGTKPRKL